MADQEQLDRLLKQGVYAWNKWREENPRVQIDLSDARLHNADLSLARLSGADLRKAELNRAFLRVADLSYADLSGANLVDTLQLHFYPEQQ